MNIMCDFDLSQALDGSFESNEIGLEHCSCKAMADAGMDLKISQHPKSIQRVATLVVMLNKMNKAAALCGTDLTDEQLCSMIMKNLVDEKVVKNVQDFTMRERKCKFQRVNSGNLCTICDTSQKDVVQPSGDLKLQAITLKGGSSQKRVIFKLAKYVSPGAEGQTVALTIMNSNWHISCSMKEDTAVLHLEFCCKEDLKVISADGNMDRFLFYKRVTGVSLTTFESVKYNGWFISTSSEAENQPVEMCKEDTARRLTCFKLN